MEKLMLLNAARAAVDVCICLDTSSSMDQNIPFITNEILRLFANIQQDLASIGKPMYRLRAKLVLFSSSNDLIHESTFLRIPEEIAEFKQQLKNVIISENINLPNGLGALAKAMQSEWCEDGWRRRHIIVLFSNSAPCQLEYDSTKANTHEKMPKDFVELSEMWGDEDEPGEMDYQAKRLFLIAPDVSFWHAIANCWENTCIRTTMNFDEKSQLLEPVRECLLHLGFY